MLSRRCLVVGRRLLSSCRPLEPLPCPLARRTPRLLMAPAQRSFFSSKKEPEAEEAAKEQEVSEAEQALHARIAELEEKNADTFDKYRRSLADFENLRNRMNKQVADAKIFGIQGFCKVGARRRIRSQE